MSTEPQSISVDCSSIEPVQLKPVADILLVVPGRSAQIQYVLGKKVPGKPAIPAVPGVVGRGQILESGTKGQPGYQPYVPAILGSPEIPAVPAVPDSCIQIDAGTIEMTDAEWDSWAAGLDDKIYRFSVVAKRLGVKLLS